MQKSRFPKKHRRWLALLIAICLLPFQAVSADDLQFLETVEPIEQSAAAPNAPSNNNEAPIYKEAPSNDPPADQQPSTQSTAGADTGIAPQNEIAPPPAPAHVEMPPDTNPPSAPGASEGGTTPVMDSTPSGDHNPGDNVTPPDSMPGEDHNPSDDITPPDSTPSGNHNPSDDVTPPDSTPSGDYIPDDDDILPVDDTPPPLDGDPTPIGGDETPPQDEFTPLPQDEEPITEPQPLAGSIGGTLWLDTLEDGMRQPGEVQIVSGYSVYLYRESDLSAPIQFTKTDANGQYFFTGVDAGVYRVVIPVMEIVHGTEYLAPLCGITSDNCFAVNNKTTADTSPITLAEGEAVTDINAAMRMPAKAAKEEYQQQDGLVLMPQSLGGSIGGTLWLDTLEDGIRQPEETEIVSGYSVYLYHESDLSAPAQSAKSDSNGQYLFTGIGEGAYRVVILARDIIGGIEYLAPLCGGTSGNSFRVNNNDTACTLPITLVGYEAIAVTGINAAMRTAVGIVADDLIPMPEDEEPQPFDGSIGGTLWLDASEDGIRQSEETEIVSGYSVYLYRESDLSAPVQSANSDSAGQYLFTGIGAGTYQVVIPPTETIDSTEYLAPLCGITPDNSFAVYNNAAAHALPITLAGDEAITDIDAAMRLSMEIAAMAPPSFGGSIGGTLWLDTLEDGMRQPEETETISGYPVYLYLESDLDTYVQSANTDSSGQYVFTGIDGDAGAYRVVIPAMATVDDTEYLAPLCGVTADNRFVMAEDYESAYAPLITLAEDEAVTGIDAAMRTPMGIVAASYHQGDYDFITGVLDGAGIDPAYYDFYLSNYTTWNDAERIASIELTGLALTAGYAFAPGTGICSALEVLRMNNSNLGSLDLTNCASLIELQAQNNSLTEIDVADLVNLTKIDCGGNTSGLTIKASGCESLDVISIYSANLENLNIDNTNLSWADLWFIDTNANLTTISAESCPLMTGINDLTPVAYPHLKTLNVSGCSTLVNINLPNALALEAVNVTGCMALTHLTLSTATAVSVTGFADCESLQLLNLSSALSSVEYDFSSNTALVSLQLNACVKKLNISNTMLNSGGFLFNGGTPQLETLTAENCLSLTGLVLYEYDLLETVNLAGCVNLETLSLAEYEINGNVVTYGSDYAEALRSLDVSGCESLTEIIFTRGNNSMPHYPLESLDLSGCTSLTKIHCQYNNLSSLTLPGSGNSLTQLYCQDNLLTGALNVSGYNHLVDMNCSKNGLTAVDASGASALVTLDCSKNSIGNDNLDLTQCTSLWQLICYENKLTALDVSSAANTLVLLNCYSNQIDMLTFGTPTESSPLSFLYCQDNQLTVLDIADAGKFPSLVEVTCNNNQLKTLDVSQRLHLTYVNVQDNSTLEEINVSGCIELKQLPFISGSTSKLKTYKASGCIEMGDDGAPLILTGGVLETLEVDGCAKLAELYCGGNALTKLDVTGCAVMTTLICNDQQQSAVPSLKAINITGTTLDMTMNCMGNPYVESFTEENGREVTFAVSLGEYSPIPNSYYIIFCGYTPATKAFWLQAYPDANSELEQFPFHQWLCPPMGLTPIGDSTLDVFQLDAAISTANQDAAITARFGVIPTIDDYDVNALYSDGNISITYGGTYDRHYYPLTSNRQLYRIYNFGDDPTSPEAEALKAGSLSYSPGDEPQTGPFGSDITLTQGDEEKLLPGLKYDFYVYLENTIGGSWHFIGTFRLPWKQAIQAQPMYFKSTEKAPYVVTSGKETDTTLQQYRITNNTALAIDVIFVKMGIENAAGLRFVEDGTSLSDYDIRLDLVVKDDPDAPVIAEIKGLTEDTSPPQFTRTLPAGESLYFSFTGTYGGPYGKIPKRPELKLSLSYALNESAPAP